MARTWTASQEAAMTLRGKTLLVSAAAGSGKTSVLTERIIRSLTDREHPADISRLLVVTFTRAAAAELKSRIAEALSTALAESPGDRHLSKQLLLLGSAQISTIDSFFQKIVRSNFEQLGLPASFRIADEAEIHPIATEILESLIEEFYRRYARSEHTGAAFSQIDGNRFAEALDHLLSNRSDGKLNDVLLDFFNLFSSYPEGIAILKHGASELRRSAEGEFMETPYGRRLAEYLQELFEGYLSELQEIETSLAYDPDVAQKCSGILASDQAFCRGMLAVLEEGSYEKLRGVANSFLSGRFPTIRNKPDEVAYYQTFRAVFRKELSAKVLEKLEWPAEQVRRQLLQTADLCEMLYELYAEYEARIMAEKNLRGILEYNDVRSMLYRMLATEDGNSSEFAKSLASQYDAVYIDEYQDVDLLQDRIFALIGETRRFMVGDIKQSIYGFRGSDPSIFASYRRAMPLHTEAEAAHANGICVFMSENFRCNRSVIDFANRICGFLFSACEKSVGYRPQDDLVCSKTVAQRDGEAVPTVPVQVAVFDASPKKNADEAESEGDAHDESKWTAAEISRLLREERLDNGAPITPSDITILVRNKAHGTAFAKALEALGIPVASDTATDFLHEPLMTDTLNLLRALDNPYRDLPLSEFLLSPFGRFSLEEISEIRESLPNQHALYDALLEKATQKDPLGQKCDGVLRWMQSMQETAQTLPADHFLRLLYLEEPFAPYGQDPILLFLYEQARLYQRSSWCGLYGFLSHVDRMLEGQKVSANGLVKAEKAVTVMTVHHSKGLEFPVVFLSACGAAFNRSDLRDTLMFHKSIGCASKLYNGETGERENTLLREMVKQELDLEQTEESIRTLYVALTRARERLYVTGTLRGKWETALANASVVRRGNRSAILSANSYLSWVLSAWQEATQKKQEFPCIFRHISPEEVSDGVPWKHAAQTQELSEGSADISAVTAHYAEICNRHKTHRYPLEILHTLPTKAAASKLRPNLLDLLQEEEEEDEMLQTQIELMRSAPGFESLLMVQDRVTPAERGTATHAFLELCNFDLLRRHGIDAECARLTAEKFLTEEATDILDREQLEAFLKSDLFGWIAQAERIYREQKFSLFMPFSELTQNEELARSLRSHELFVQGSIDLLLQMPNGELYLIDYKTDRLLSNEKDDPSRYSERMRAVHGEQLSCYTRAVTALFGRAPDKICIYSLPLGKEIEF